MVERLSSYEPSPGPESLFAIEERFRLLVESVKDYAIFMLDARGRVASWNRGAERINGYRADEITGQYFARFYPEEDVRAGKCEMELEVAARDGRFEDEGWRVRKSGERFWANVVITPLRNPAGELVGFAKVTRDLTERKAAEEERLRAGQVARERLHMLAELAEGLAGATSIAEVGQAMLREAISFFAADTCVLHQVDERTRALTLVMEQGCNPDVLAAVRVIEPGNPVYDIGVGKADAMWVESEADYAQQLAPVAALPASGVRAKAFWCLPLFAEGRPIGIIGVGYHEPRHFPAEEREFAATFARQSGQALARARRLEADRVRETQASFLADATAALAASLDYETTLARVAQLAVPRLADWCAVDLVVPGQATPRRVATAHVDARKVPLAQEYNAKYGPRPEDPGGVMEVLRTARPELYPFIPDEVFAAHARNEEELRFTRELGLRSAMIVPLIVSGRVLGALSFVFAESERRYTASDVPFAEELARRSAMAIENARLFASEQEARRNADVASRAKDEFLAIVSHELRTPLNAIMGWSKMLSTQDFDEARRKRALGTIERNSVAMAQLIEDLLDMSRFISGKMRLEKQPVDLARVVEAAVESIHPAAAAKDITLAADIEAGAPSLTGDPARLQQVVWNLLSNAVKFTPRDGRVDVRLRTAGTSLEVRVEDNGHGIDPSFLGSVFEPFRQEDGGTTRSRAGLGLGLAISHQLVELHGGTITAASGGEGHGATFVVTLPVLAERPAARQPRESSRYERPPSLRDLRVLVVDDEEDVRYLVATILEDCGCVVVTASSVDDAMGRLAEHVPDVLVSDVGMPGEDGYDLIRRVRALPAASGGDVPAAALTAYARTEDRDRLLEAGFSIHVAKPIEPAELIATVATLTRFFRRDES